jgi:hypothetical protein
MKTVFFSSMVKTTPFLLSHLMWHLLQTMYVIFMMALWGLDVFEVGLAKEPNQRQRERVCVSNWASERLNDREFSKTLLKTILNPHKNF